MYSRITRSSALGLIIVVAALASGTPVSATTPQGLKADGLRWQAMADFYRHKQDMSHYTEQGLKADGLRWQAMATRYRWLQSHRGENASASASASPPPQVSAISSGAGFDWGDAGLGAASGFVVAVCASVLVILTRRTRRTNVAA